MEKPLPGEINRGGPIILGSPIRSRCPTNELEDQENLEQTPTGQTLEIEILDTQTSNDVEMEEPQQPTTPIATVNGAGVSQTEADLIGLNASIFAGVFPTQKKAGKLVLRKRNEPFISRRRYTKEAIFTSPSDAREAALDCRIQAANMEDDREKARADLDLINIVREYTENGVLSHSKSLLATQLRSLENSTRAVANRARELSNLPATSTNIPRPPTAPSHASRAPQPPQLAPQSSYANIATRGQEKWTTIPFKAPAKKAAAKPKETRTAIFHPRCPIPETSSLYMRNAFNKAFKEKYPTRGLVISGVTISPRGNLVLTVIDGLTAKFLIENKAVIDSVTPTVSVVENRSWFKIAVHGVPTADARTLSREEFADAVKEEIKTFNKDLSPIGTPYWLSPEDNRNQRRAGSIALAFETEAEARTAISKRLSIFGVSCKAEKLKGPRKNLPPRKQTPF